MTTYYVDYTTGLDSNDGLAPTDEGGGVGPFKNIPTTGNATSNANFTPSAGDTIYLKYGSIWPDQKRLQGASGTQGNQVTFDAYGDNTLSKPRLEGWESYIDTDWAYTEANDIWYAQNNDSTAAYARVFFNKIPQNGDAANATSCNATNPWFLDEDNDYLYVFSGSASESPTDVYGEVTAFYSNTTQRSYGLYLAGKEYITIKNICFVGQQTGCILNHDAVGNDYLSDIVIDNCEFLYNRTGIELQGLTYGSFQDLRISNNYFNAYRTVLEGNTTTNPGGDGIVFREDVDGAVIEGNTIYDYGHSCINLNNTTGGNNPVQNITVKNNYLSASNSTYCRGLSTNGINGLVKNIDIHSNYIYNTNVRNQIEGENINFINNIVDTVRECFVNFGYDLEEGVSIGARSSADVINVVIANNIVLNTFEACFKIRDVVSYPITSLFMYNNIAYATSNSSTDLAFKTEENDTFPTIPITNNCFYSTETATVINWDGTPYTVSAAEAAITGMSENIATDPKLNNDYSLETDSPCIGTGTATVSERDYSGRYKKSLTYDIGAKWFNAHEDSTINTLLASGGTL
jgi:hypothetical protein